MESLLQKQDKVKLHGLSLDREEAEDSMVKWAQKKTANEVGKGCH